MRKLLLGLMVLALMTGAATAAPTTAPSWYTGGPGQTYQMFDFKEGDIKQVLGTNEWLFNATIDENPYGVPTAVVKIDTLNGHYRGYIADTEDPGDMIFVAWKIEVGSGMYIPNSSEPLPVKNIWVEIRFEPELVKYYVTLDDFNKTVGTVTYADIPTEENEWDVAKIGWEIRPNPRYEYLWFYFENAGCGLDYIAVWTQCIPAPGAFLLAGIGTAVVGWARRRRAF